MTDKNVMQLSKPITAHGEEITEIEFSEPTGKQVIEIGLPYSMSSDSDISLKMALVCRYITALGKIPPSAVAQMSPPDLNSAAWVVAGFFIGEEKEARTPKSESESL